MIGRRAEAGCGALLLTVDLAVPGTRYRDYRAGLSAAAGSSGGSRRLARCCGGPAGLWDVGAAWAAADASAISSRWSARARRSAT